MSTPSLTIGHEGATTTATLVVDGRLVRLHGRTPVAEADRLLAPILDTAVSSPSLIVVVGLGLGYLLDALEARGFAGRVIALEVEPATLDAMRARRSWTAWDASGRLRVVVGPGFDGLDDVRAWLEPLETAPPVVEHPVLARERAADVARARAALTQAWYAARANAEARAAQAPVYLRNTLLNAKGLASEAASDSLDGAWQGASVIVAAAGPSLDETLPALRDVAERALLIAVDTAARPLLAAGIMPDVVVALDPTPTNGRHLIGLPGGARSPWLVAEGSVDPIAVRAFTGRTFFFQVSGHQPWPWLESLGLRAGRLRAWGSVLTSALDLALRGGAARVVFVGADLAFTGGRPYCRGTTFEHDWQDLVARGASLSQIWADALARWDTVSAADIAGGTTITARHLLAFRDWIAETSRTSTGCAFVNATPAGVLAGGRIVHHTLAAALATTDRRAACHVRGVIAEAHRTAARPDATRLAAAAGALWPAFVEKARVAPLTDWEALTGAALERHTTGLGLALMADIPLPGPATDPLAVCGADAWPPDDMGLEPSDQQWLAALCARGPVEVLHTDRNVATATRAVAHAVEALLPGRTLVVIDETVPPHGIGLRRALVEAAALRALHLDDGRYRDWGSRLFVVGDRIESATGDPRDRLGWDDHALARRIAAAIAERYAPATAFDAGGLSSAWTDALARVGVTVTHDGAEHADVALLLYAADRVGAGERQRLIDRATAASDLVLFGAVPPAHGTVTPDGAPPFETWGRLFAERGFALADDWRREVEAATGLTTWFDLLLGFRRVCAPGDTLPPAAVEALARLVGRVQEQFEAIVRLHVNEHHRRRTLAAAPLPPPELATVEVALPPERLRAATDSAACVEFHSAFTSYWVARHPTALFVTEDGRALPPMRSGGGGWRVVDGALELRSPDGTDVRLNGRRYALRLPSDLARLESSPPAVAPHLPV